MNKRASIEQQLYDYVDSKEHCEIVTLNGITFEVMDDCELQAEYKFIDTEDTSLSVLFSSNRKKFVEALNIKRVADIYTLKGDVLMELYNKGLAELVCCVTLNYSYMLCFQKAGNKIVATNDSNVKHIVPTFENLETHDEYISYTMRYYKFLEVNEN